MGSTRRVWPPESYCHARSAVAETNYGGAGGQARFCLGCWLEDIAICGETMPARRFKDWFGVMTHRTELLDPDTHQAVCECTCEHRGVLLLGQMDVSCARLVCDACLASEHMPPPRPEGIASGSDTPRGRALAFAAAVRSLNLTGSRGSELVFSPRFDFPALEFLADDVLVAHLEEEWDALRRLAVQARRLDDTAGITDGPWFGPKEARRPFYAAMYAIALRDLLAPERFRMLVAPWRAQLPDLDLLR